MLNFLDLILNLVFKLMRIELHDSSLRNYPVYIFTSFKFKLFYLGKNDLLKIRYVYRTVSKLILSKRCNS